MSYIEKTYGIGEAYSFEVRFYDGGHKSYRSGYAADRFARRCAREGRWCSLHALTGSGWVELAAC